MVRTSNKCHTRENCRRAILLVTLPLLLAAPSVTARTLVDRLVADVNSEAILYSQIEAKLKLGHPVIVTEYPAPPTASDYEKALQDQINFELILQHAEQLEISVTDEQAEDEIKRFLAGRGLTMDGLRESLRQEGMTYEEYKKSFRDSMILRAFQGRVILPLVKVTDKEVENYYLRRAGAKSDNVSVQLRQIVFSAANLGSSSVARQRAESTYSQLRNGLEFEKAVEQFSTDPYAKKNGGNLPTLKLNDLASELRDKIEPLSTGEFTSPVEIDGNWVIFQLVERSLSNSSDFAARKEALQNELRTQQISSQTITWLADQRRRVKPKIISE